MRDSAALVLKETQFGVAGGEDQTASGSAGNGNVGCAEFTSGLGHLPPLCRSPVDGKLSIANCDGERCETVDLFEIGKLRHHGVGRRRR